MFRNYLKGVKEENICILKFINEPEIFFFTNDQYKQKINLFIGSNDISYFIFTIKMLKHNRSSNDKFIRGYKH